MPAPTWLFPWLLLGMLGAPSVPSARGGAVDLADAERRFAEAVATRGIRDGFLEFLAEDGILLRPRPVHGIGHFRTAPDDPGVLEWAPGYARIAAGGDLGFTTGPWRYRASRTNETVAATGQYLTIWRLTSAGWRASLDGGIGGPPAPFPTRVETAGPDEADEPLAGWQQTRRGRDLQEMEDVYSRRAARDGEAAALEAHGHKRVRMLRQGAAPVLGRSAGVAFLQANRARLRDARQGLVIAAGGDLGYAWGESERLGSGTEPPRAVRSWVRIWHRSGWSGTWRVLLDLAVEYPPPGTGPGLGS